jgi:hypothetical protein
MSIQNCTKALARRNDGQLWYIYNNADALEYRVFKNDKFTSEGILIANKVLSGFAADMDEKGNVHLLCQSLSGELVYWHYNGQQWCKQMLSKYDPTRYILKYPVLKLSGSDIHIIFALGNMYNTADRRMYHYLWHQAQWKTLKIGSLNIGCFINPFWVDWDRDGNIYLLYSDRDNNNINRIYYAFFDAGFQIWSAPQPLTPNDKSSGCPTLLIDGSNMHLAWNIACNNRICVEHAIIPLNKCREASITRSSVVSPDNTDAEHPLLFSFEQKLWLIWISNTGINRIYSNDQGITWHKHDPIVLTNNAELQCFRYLDQRFPNIGLVYGNIDNGFTLVPPIPLNEPEHTEKTIKTFSPVKAEKETGDELQEQADKKNDLEKITSQLDMIKKRQTDLLQSLIEADQHYQEISIMLEELESFAKSIKSKNLKREGFLSIFKKWLSK